MVFLKLSALANEVCVLNACRRPYSMYNKFFKSPIYRPEDIPDLEKAPQLKHIKVKASKSNENCSFHHDIVVQKFTNYIMRCGKKITARNELEDAFMHIKRIQLEKYNSAKTEQEKREIITDPLRLLKMAVQNSRPLLKLAPIRRGGSTYQVPVPISDTESVFRAMRWIVLSSQEKERVIPFSKQLAVEILDAAFHKGRVIKQKLELHKQCEANRAYAHFRWT